MEPNTINKILEIQESYQMPEKLMNILKDKETREVVFQKFIQEENDLSYDWFTDYFQQEHGDRDKYKQDFTPDSICGIITGINGVSDSIADICAGTGGLTIKCWRKNPQAFYHCEELSKRAIPILLFNLAIRNMDAEVVNVDILTNEVFQTWRLRPAERFSDIQETVHMETRKYNSVVMNPPYSLSWSGKADERLSGYLPPPKSKADYVFVLHGLNLMQDNGKLLAILPHGVLFRGGAEGEIRKQLIEKGVLHEVIGLPEKLFLNTSIPVCIIVLQSGYKDVYFVDASKECEKDKSQNKMTQKNIQTVLTAHELRRDIDKISHLSSLEEIQENGYNLNIPRYVDTFEREELPPLFEIFHNLRELEKETKAAEDRFFQMMTELVGTDESSALELQKAKEEIEKYREERDGQLRFE